MLPMLNNSVVELAIARHVRCEFEVEVDDAHVDDVVGGVVEGHDEHDGEVAHGGCDEKVGDCVPVGRRQCIRLGGAHRIDRLRRFALLQLAERQEQALSARQYLVGEPREQRVECDIDAGVASQRVVEWRCASVAIDELAVAVDAKVVLRRANECIESAPNARDVGRAQIERAIVAAAFLQLLMHAVATPSAPLVDKEPLGLDFNAQRTVTIVGQNDAKSSV
jgi:hypothetical protein